MYLYTIGYGRYSCRYSSEIIRLACNLRDEGLSNTKIRRKILEDQKVRIKDDNHVTQMTHAGREWLDYLEECRIKAERVKEEAYLSRLRRLKNKLIRHSWALASQASFHWPSVFGKIKSDPELELTRVAKLRAQGKTWAEVGISMRKSSSYCQSLGKAKRGSETRPKEIPCLDPEYFLQQPGGYHDRA